MYPDLFQLLFGLHNIAYSIVPPLISWDHFDRLPLWLKEIVALLLTGVPLYSQAFEYQTPSQTVVVVVVVFILILHLVSLHGHLLAILILFNAVALVCGKIL